MLATATTATVLASNSNVYDALVAIAIPLNTALLVLLAFLSNRHRKQIKEVAEISTSSALAAASAATVASDAARITKELGGMLRTTESRGLKPEE